MNNHCNLKYYSSGSYGILIKSELNDYIYKITEFSDYSYISTNNFNEMLYLNFFRINYPDLLNKSNNYLPIQNINTKICSLNDFIKSHKINNDLKNKIKYKLQITSNDLIVINKMKFYPFTLYELNNKLDIKKIYFAIKNIILGLHFFHSNNLAHGDFKSINIISDKNEFKIIDYGGVKSINNPKYQCTCTCTYRSPEDFKFESILETSKNDNKLYEYDITKSDIWSLGLVLQEMINGYNPIQNEYYNLITNKSIDKKDIDNKIFSYLKNTKNFIKDEKNIFSSNNTFKNTYRGIDKNKIIKLIEQILVIEPNKRISLNALYLDLFNEELPNLEKEKICFDYIIKCIKYKKRFIDFRSYYYEYIKYTLEILDEKFLYPFICNLLDRFIISIINMNLSNKIEIFKFSKYNFILELLNYTENYDDEYNIMIYNMNIIYCSIYLISKLVILREDIEFDKSINELQKNLKLGWDKITQVDIITLCQHIISIIELLDYDIIRIKLLIYSNTNEEYIDNIIKIIDNFDIDKIIKYIE